MLFCIRWCVCACVHTCVCVCIYVFIVVTKWFSRCAQASGIPFLVLLTYLNWSSSCVWMAYLWDPEGHPWLTTLFSICLYCGSFSTLDSSEKHWRLGWGELSSMSVFLSLDFPSVKWSWEQTYFDHKGSKGQSFCDSADDQVPMWCTMNFCSYEFWFYSNDGRVSMHIVLSFKVGVPWPCPGCSSTLLTPSLV